MAQTSIPCESTVRDKHSDQKPDDVSWNEYLDQLAESGEVVVKGQEINYDKLDEMYSAITTLEERLNSIDRTLKEIQGQMR